MIGNDLVDLQQASRDSNWMRRGFLNKLFSEPEQQYIMLADQPSEMVWVLWSMKEAAYKIYNRASGIREFAPVKLKCKLYSTRSVEYFGEVRIDGNIYYTTSEVLPGDYVHSIAALSPNNFGCITRSLSTLSDGRDYKAMRPKCVSHHGRYFALIF